MHHQGTDRAAADHQDAAARDRRGTGHRVQSDCHRFDERGLGQRDGGRNDDDLAFVGDQFFPERALHVREAGRAAVEAHVEA